MQNDQLQILHNAGISICWLDLNGAILLHGEVMGSFDDLKSGKYSVIHCHPEALLNTATGEEILASGLHVGCICVEIHIKEIWYGTRPYFNFIQMCNVSTDEKCSFSHVC